MKYSFPYKNQLNAKPFCIVILFVIVSLTSAFAQDLKSLKKYLDAAEYDIYMEEYESAVKSLLNYYAKDSANAYINYRIGYCYLNTVNNKINASSFLQKAILDASPNYPDGSYDQRKSPLKAWLAMGDAYSLNYQFDKAIFAYQRFLKLSKTKDKETLARVNKKIEIAQNAKLMVTVPVKFEKQLFQKEFNSGYLNKNPAISVAENFILYTVEESDAVQIFFAYKKGENRDGKWSKPEDLTEVLKISGDLTCTYISGDGNTMLFYAYNNKIYNLYMSKFNGKKWGKGTWLGAGINSKNQRGACLSKDGRTIYYASDKPGGYGGYDIYKSTLNSNNQWGTPINMGDKINTPFDEDNPFLLDDDRTLFFASQGHAGLGDFDIFYSRMKDNAEWDTPVNLGYPFNTPDKEDFYFPLGDGFTGFCSMKQTEPDADPSVSRVIYKVKITPLDTQLLAQQKNKNLIKAKEDVKSLDTISAERLHQIHVNDTNAFTILVKEARNAEESSYLKDIEGMKLYSKDNIFRYYFGLYYNPDTAKKDLQKFVDIGFKGAELKKTSKDEFFAQAISANLVTKNLSDIKIEPQKQTTESIAKKEITPEERKKENTIKNDVVEKQTKKEINKIQKNEGTKYFEDEVKVPLYTIQVCATKKSTNDYKYFKDLQKIRENKCTDSWYRYTSGDFDDIETAKEALIQVKAAGFAGAYVISYKDYRAKYLNGKATTANVKILNTSGVRFEIQICSSTESSIDNRFLNLDQIKEYACNDGRYRYTFGDFQNYQLAKEAIAPLISYRFNGAFVVTMNAFEQKYFNGDMAAKTKLIDGKSQKPEIKKFVPKKKNKKKQTI